MKLSNLFLSSLLLSIPLSADRIMITKTAKKEDLKQIQYKLKKVNTKMYVKKTGSGYVVYSKEYTSSLETIKSLKKLKRYFPNAYVKKTSKKETPIQTKTPYFVNVSYGLSNMSVEVTGQASQSNSGNNFGIDGGYYISDSLYCSLAYVNTSSDSLTTSTFYGSVDYKYNIMKDTDVYVGAIVGYSSLAVTGGGSSTSPAVGFELGTSYEVIKNIPLALTYQNLLFDQKAAYGTNSELSVNMLHNFKLSVGYKF